ncbi:MAG: hypothetical protein JWQ71_2819 [Pedosphaera sp.]|nr:hypothetical protein [Pedosphaera sp.]
MGGEYQPRKTVSQIIPKALKVRHNTVPHAGATPWVTIATNSPSEYLKTNLLSEAKNVSLPIRTA